jgi:uncharacterized membrane protein YGL010W
MEALRTAYASELNLYRRCHAHPANFALHCVCVPVEWISWLLALAQLPAVAQLSPHWPASPHWLLARPHWLVQIALAAYTCPLNPPTSAALAGGHLALAALVDVACAVLPTVRAQLGLALAAWLCSWLVQVPLGHWLIERNQPAMANGLTLNAVLLSVALAWDWSEPGGRAGTRSRVRARRPGGMAPRDHLLAEQ